MEKNMRIGFDARLINQTGVGRYISNILPLLIKQNKKDSWVVLVRKKEKEDLKKIIPEGFNVEIVEFNFRWHGFLEQLFLPFVLYRRKLNIFHTPYINVPVFYFKRKAVTIHDLTVLTIKTGKASTKGIVFYTIKRLGYKIALRSALRSQVVYVVTNSVREDIISKFPKIQKNKIVVATNGFTKLNSTRSKTQVAKISSYKPFFLYVGNAHPHKNLDFLVDSLSKFFTKIPNFKIVLAGKKDYFMERLQDKVDRLKNKENFIFIDSPTDSFLSRLYEESSIVILPSLKEGFGLQILEAMDKNSIIVASRIPPYSEVARDLAFYFTPDSDRSFYMALSKALKIKPSEKTKLIKKYKLNLQRYSWENSAKTIYSSYFDHEDKTKSLISKSF